MTNLKNSSPAAALRERFGDNKPPNITRKITACVACRKQKIRCHMNDGRPPCTRCKKRGLPCNVNKSLQMILESDADWKNTIEQRVRSLEDRVVESNHASRRASIAQPPSETELLSRKQTTQSLQRDDANGCLAHGPPSSESQTSHHWEIVMDPNSGPGGIPGSVVTETGQDQTFHPDNKSQVRFDDQISRGIISLQQGQEYLDIFQDRLNHFLYQILPERKSLVEIRQEPLLLAAICAVGALHTAAPAFEECYQEFVKLAGHKCFASKSTLDDVRALCIGAFWLSGISWKSVGVAVHIATEMQLHRSIFRALDGDRQHYLRTRLYYLLYVADHHHSIPYGRPPMTRTDESIRSSLQFLQTEHALAVEDDARLVSQVQFWRLGSDVYAELGVDLDRPLNAVKLSQVRRLSIRLDQLRAEWTEAFSQNRFVGNYPKKGVSLHYHFSKLYLYSHAFRGVGRPGFRPPDVAMEIDELANNAMLSATTILKTVTTDLEIQGHLNGLPTYFDVMIAFAVVFVLKVSTKYSSSVSVSTSGIHDLVARLVHALKGVTQNMHPRHLLASVAHGTDTLLAKCWPINTGEAAAPNHSDPGATQAGFDQSLYAMSQDWTAGLSDHFFIGDFDFLANQEMQDELAPGFQ